MQISVAKIKSNSVNQLMKALSSFADNWHHVTRCSGSTECLIHPVASE